MISPYLVNFNLEDLPQEHTTVLVIGSGVAGLYLAARIADSIPTVLLCKSDPQECCTSLALGGIAAAMGEEDSPGLHYADTMEAGVGLCSPDAVNLIVNEGPRLIKQLLAWGVEFDHCPQGLALGLEGAHGRRRIVHARGDATGAVLWHGLWGRVITRTQLNIMPQTTVLDLLVEDGRCYGALVLTEGGTLKAILSSATVLASGGAGQIYPDTTNPPVSTGDGVAMAYRAGAEVTDLEFFQFHPTVLCYQGTRGVLISEAVRGEGALIRNRAGERFMPAYHPQAELAPRDVVARAELEEIARQGGGPVYLDLTHLPVKILKRRFSHFTATCQSVGLEPERDWIPVAPQAHYTIGGVRTDLRGRTNIESLYACGESACTGVHGANRLASNSLLEGLVFGEQVALDLIGNNLKRPSCPLLRFDGLLTGGPAAETLRENLTKQMRKNVGLVRDQEGLARAAAELEGASGLLAYEAQNRTGVEIRNLITVASLMIDAASWRRETRGCHYRTDFKGTNDAFLKHRIVDRTGSREESVRA